MPRVLQGRGGGVRRGQGMPSQRPHTLQRIVVVNRSAAQDEGSGRLHDSFASADYESRYKGGGK